MLQTDIVCFGFRIGARDDAPGLTLGRHRRFRNPEDGPKNIAPVGVRVVCFGLATLMTLWVPLVLSAAQGTGHGVWGFGITGLNGTATASDRT